MTLRFYNTMTRQKEEFKPIEDKKIGIYVCGITAYDVCHIGHARSAVVFDIITRYLRYKGYNVIYVKNFTDVDDKIIKKQMPRELVFQRYQKGTLKSIMKTWIRLASPDPQWLPELRKT
jgi:cysteinyl-tRNA synthetase (EC 6.1.1.16)